MAKLYRVFQGLFCVCFILAALSILSLNGYAAALLAAAAVWLLLRRKA